MAKIAISKPLLFGMSAVCLISVLGFVFLLGRESARSSTQALPVPVAPRSSATIPPPADAAETSDSTPQISTANPHHAIQASSQPLAPAPVTPKPVDDSRAAVAAYFEAVDHLQGSEPGNNPQGQAQEIVMALVKGDTSGLDGMIKQSEAAEQRLANLNPPPACANFHRESQVNLKDSLEIMRGMKRAIESSDTSALNGLAGRANDLRSRAEALQHEEESLRKRFGLQNP